MSNPNTIDYSNLNKSLNLKGERLKDITKKVSENIGKIFLETNERKSDKDKSMQKKVDRLSDSIDNASEGTKANFILTVDYLLKNKLLKTDKIKSLKLRALEDDSKTNDEKLENILIELKKDLSESDKLKLDQHISKGLLNLSKEADSADKLGEKITDLEQQNTDLKSELDALDAVTEVSEKAVLKRWSRYKMIRIGNSIKRINDSSLDPETKARKVLWQANSFAIFGSGKRFDWVINKLPKKFDVNEEYEKAVSKLKKKMDESDNDGEKVAIRYVMKQVDKAHTDYIKATNISEETKRQNMRDINMKMAA